MNRPKTEVKPSGVERMIWLGTAIEASRIGDIATWDLKVFAVKPKPASFGNDFTIESPFDDDYQNFSLHCQMDWSGNHFRTYAHSACYSGWQSVKFRDAEKMFRVLERIDKIERAFPVEPTSFGQYVQLVAQGLKIKRYLEPSSRARREHSGYEYNASSIREVGRVVDDRLQEFGRSKVPVQEAS